MIKVKMELFKQRGINNIKIIDGLGLAEKIKNNIVKEIAKIDKETLLDAGNTGLVKNRPNLAIILVGEREDSKLYVDMKEKEAKAVGIDTHIYKCETDIPEKEIFEMIGCLNKDSIIDAILVQLPLPEGFDTDGIIKAIDPAKDVDRFHPDNLKELLTACSKNEILPPVLGVALEMLADIKCNLAGKNVCIVANSDIFGRTMAQALECRKADVKTARADDKNLKEKTSQADILITAVGIPGLIKNNMVKKNAIVIDIGITRVGKKILGDVDFEDVLDKVKYITPVPGGVGPMTIALLFKNTLELYKRRKK